MPKEVERFRSVKSSMLEKHQIIPPIDWRQTDVSGGGGGVAWLVGWVNSLVSSAWLGSGQRLPSMTGQRLNQRGSALVNSSSQRVSLMMSASGTPPLIFFPRFAREVRATNLQHVENVFSGVWDTCEPPPTFVFDMVFSSVLVSSRTFTWCEQIWILTILISGQF